MLTTLDGIPVAYDRVPTHTNERAVADEILDQITNADVWADKGFLGERWQQDIRATTENRSWTAKRHNQRRNPAPFNALLGSIRERIERTFHELQNTGRAWRALVGQNGGRLGNAHCEQGDASRREGRVACAIGIDVLTFTVIKEA